MADAPWRSYAADYRDFFNYGMDMRTWKEYAKRVQLHRMESAMQRKIQTFSTPQVQPHSLPACGQQDCYPNEKGHVAAVSQAPSATCSCSARVGGLRDVRAELEHVVERAWPMVVISS